MDSRWGRALGAAGVAGLVAGLGGPAHPVVWTQAAGVAVVLGLGGGLVVGAPPRHARLARFGLLGALFAALWAAEAAAVGIALDALQWLEETSYVSLALRGLSAAGRAQAALPLGAALGLLVLEGRASASVAGALVGRAAAVSTAAGVLAAMAAAADAGDGAGAAAWGWALPVTALFPAAGAAIAAGVFGPTGHGTRGAAAGAALLLGALHASSGRLLWVARGAVSVAAPEAAALPPRAGTAEAPLSWDGPVPAELPRGRTEAGAARCAPAPPPGGARARLGRALALLTNRTAGDLRARVSDLSPTAVGRLTLVGRAALPGPPVIEGFFTSPAVSVLLEPPPAPHHRVHVQTDGASRVSAESPPAPCALSAADGAPLPALAAAAIRWSAPTGPCTAVHLLPAPWSGPDEPGASPVPTCTDAPREPR